MRTCAARDSNHRKGGKAGAVSAGTRRGGCGHWVGQLCFCGAPPRGVSEAPLGLAVRGMELGVATGKKTMRVRLPKAISIPVSDPSVLVHDGFRLLPRRILVPDKGLSDRGIPIQGLVLDTQDKTVNTRGVANSPSEIPLADWAPEEWSEKTSNQQTKRRRRHKYFGQAGTCRSAIGYFPLLSTPCFVAFRYVGMRGSLSVPVSF